jgi:hypothetical protein
VARPHRRPSWNETEPEPGGQATERDNREWQDDEGEPLQARHGPQPSELCASACQRAGRQINQRMAPIDERMHRMSALPQKSRITAERLIQHLTTSGFVVMKGQLVPAR